NGIGLAIVVPSTQSLVADLTEDNNRRTAFGWLQLSAKLGPIIGRRIAFHLVAQISVVVGILVRLYSKDPRFSDTDGKGCRDQILRWSLVSELKFLIKETKSVVIIPSF
ncbi:Major facilitator superfamily domain containing protein, partial [Parasponia andersonii]